MHKRILAILLSILFVLPLCAVSHADAVTRFDFPTNIMYGGTSADCGDFIYYSESGAVFVRLIGSEEYAFVIGMDASCLNIDGGCIYFLCDDTVYRCEKDGSMLTSLYSGNDLSCLYVSDDYIYFMSGHAVYRLAGGNAVEVFENLDMRCFIPVSPTEFNWYADNPDYVEIDDEIAGLYGIELEERYIGYSYSSSTGLTVPLEAEDTSSENGYTGTTVQIGDVTLPFDEYLPGSYFTKNGLACTCHGNPSIDHVANPDNCNCMRYYPTGDKNNCEVDLLGTQCFGFCRLIFYKCFGFLDHQYLNGGKYYSVGSLTAANVTPNSCRELLMKASAGAHIRLTRGHSMAILTMDEDYVTVYHANAGGDGVASSPCVVSTRRLSWSDFASIWAYLGISYINMPVDYPGAVVSEHSFETGIYRVKSDTPSQLNIRASGSISAEVIGGYDAGEYIYIEEISDRWGRTDLGWVSLDYCIYTTAVTLSPAEDSIFKVEGDYLLVRGDRATFDDFCQSLYNQNAHGYSASSQPLGENDYLTSGCTVTLVYGSNEFSPKTVVVVGDINGNGIMDIADYLATKRIIMGTYIPTELERLSADADRNGDVNALDYMKLGRYLKTGNYS